MAFAPFLVLERIATPPAAAVVYLTLLPLLAAGIISLYSGLRFRKQLMGRRVKRAMRGGGTGSVEALVRWKHASHGLVPPGAFLASLEDTRLAKQLDLHVLHLALPEAETWQRAGRHLTVAVNFSPTSLLEPPLADELRAALVAHGLSPESLELEITELAFENGPAPQVGLERVKAVGVQIALDDFGVGQPPGPGGQPLGTGRECRGDARFRAAPATRRT